MTACPHCGEPISEPGACCPACGKHTAPVIEEPARGSAPAAASEDVTAAEEALPAGKTAGETPVPEQTIEQAQAGGSGPEEAERESAADRRGPAFLTEPEAWNRLLRGLAIFFTALGLLALLGLALMLIQAHKLDRDARAVKENDNIPLPADPEVINFYTPAKEERVRSEGEIRYLEDELIVVSGKGLPYTDMERFFGERDVRIIGYVELADAYQVQLPEAMSLERLTETARELEKEQQVVCAAVSTVWAPAVSSVPDDPWDGKADWEEPSPDCSNWGLRAIRAPESWERFSPGVVKVGLIDSSFDSAQEDLRYASLRGNDHFSAVRSGEEGLRQHGTAVAAVIGAVHDNGRGLSGVAGDCRIYAVGSPRLCCQMDALSALADLIVQGPSVIQYSLSWPEDLAALMEEESSPAAGYYGGDPARVAGAGLERMLDKGYDFLLVVPAGNSPEGQLRDASRSCVFSALSGERLRRHILVVGAAAQDPEGGYAQAEFSGRGARVDLLAPGVDVYTALPDGKYGRRSGTSLAAAHVTGVCAAAWTLNPGLGGAQLRDLVLESAQTPVSGSAVGMVDMAAALEKVSEQGNALNVPSAREQALDAYAALLRRGVQLRLRGPFGFIWAPAEYYYLVDMNGDGVEELLLFDLNENELSASFALYGFRSGELLNLADAWDSCRFSSWSNVRLSLEIWDGRYLYAGAEKNSPGYGEAGDSFSIGYFGERLYCLARDLRPAEGEKLALIEDSALTGEGVRIGSARDVLRNR